jgi:hypothetical protein
MPDKKRPIPLLGNYDTVTRQDKTRTTAPMVKPIGQPLKDSQGNLVTRESEMKEYKQAVSKNNLFTPDVKQDNTVVVNDNIQQIINDPRILTDESHPTNLLPNQPIQEAGVLSDMFSDVGTKLLHAAETFGGSAIGDAVHMISPATAKMLDEYSMGMIPYTKQHQLEANRANNPNKWDNRVSDMADAASMVGTGLMMETAMGKLAKKMIDKNGGAPTEFLYQPMTIYNSKPVKKTTSNVVDDTGKGFKSEIDWAKWNKEIPENKSLIQEYNAIEKELNKNNLFGINPATNKPYKTNVPKEIDIVLRSSNFKKSFPEFDFDKHKIYRGERYVRKDYINKDRLTDNVFGTDDLEAALHYVKRQETGEIIHPNKIDDFLNKNEIPIDYMTYNDGTIGGINVLAVPNKSKTFTIDAKNNNWTTLPNHPKLNQEYVRYNTENIKYRINKYGKDDINLPKDYSEDALYASADNYASALNEGLKDYNMVTIKNVYDGINKPITDYIINPRTTPIKSIFYNNGMFDMTNPNIYKSIIPTLLGGGAFMNQQNKQK